MTSQAPTTSTSLPLTSVHGRVPADLGQFIGSDATVRISLAEVQHLMTEHGTARGASVRFVEIVGPDNRIWRIHVGRAHPFTVQPLVTAALNFSPAALEPADDRRVFAPMPHAPTERKHPMNILLSGLIVVIVVLLLLGAALKVVKQYEHGVLFRLGRVVGVRPPGLRVIIPLIDVMHRVSRRIVTMPIHSQGIITRDNVSVDVSAVAYFRVVDAVKSVVAIENVYSTIDQIAQTTLRKVVGQHTLDQTLSETDKINIDIRTILDVSTPSTSACRSPLVKLKDNQLPDTMKRAMARQAEAEREKRAKIINAEGESMAAAALGDASDTLMAHPLARESAAATPPRPHPTTVAGAESAPTVPTNGHTDLSHGATLSEEYPLVRRRQRFLANANERVTPPVGGSWMPRARRIFPHPPRRSDRLFDDRRLPLPVCS